LTMDLTSQNVQNFAVKPLAYLNITTIVLPCHSVRHSALTFLAVQLKRSERENDRNHP